MEDQKDQIKQIVELTEKQKKDLTEFTIEAIDLLKVKLNIEEKKMIEIKEQIEEKQNQFSSTLDKISDKKYDEYQEKLDQANKEKLNDFIETLDEKSKQKLEQFDSSAKEIVEGYLNILKQKLESLGFHDENFIKKNMYNEMQKKLNNIETEIRQIKKINILEDSDKLEKIFKRLTTENEEKKLTKNNLVFYVKDNKQKNVKIDLSTHFGVDKFIRILIHKIPMLLNDYDKEFYNIFKNDNISEAEIRDNIEIITNGFS